MRSCFPSNPRFYIVANNQYTLGGKVAVQNRPVPLSNQPLPESCEISSNAIQIEIIDRRTAIEKRFGRICIGIRREIVQPRNSSATTLATFVTEGEEGEERRGSSSMRSNLLRKEIGSGNDFLAAY